MLSRVLQVHFSPNFYSSLFSQLLHVLSRVLQVHVSLNFYTCCHVFYKFTFLSTSTRVVTCSTSSLFSQLLHVLSRVLQVHFSLNFYTCCHVFYKFGAVATINTSKYKFCSSLLISFKKVARQALDSACEINKWYLRWSFVSLTGNKGKERKTE